MEPIIIKNGRKEYAFYSDRIEVTKKDKIITTIRHDEIRDVTYNPKFGFKDMLRRGTRHMPNSFTFYYGSRYEVFTMCLSNYDFERVKTTFKIPIKLI